MRSSARHKFLQQRKQQQRFHITKGSTVEISSDEEGFRGAWFVATVIDPGSPSSSSYRPRSQTTKSPSFANKVYVEYKTIFADDTLSKPLRELVTASFIRPLPPVSPNPPAFELNDVVDAFYRDGWWTGVITRVLEQGSSFVVTFQSPPDEIQFDPSNLRFHLDWVNGNWVRPRKKKLSGLMFNAGKKVEVSLEKEHSQDVWFPATIIEDQGNDSFMVEYQTSEDNNEVVFGKIIVGYHQLRPCPPLIKNEKFELFDKVDAFYDFGWWSGVITKELADSKYNVYFKLTNLQREFNHWELRPHLDWRDGKWLDSSLEAVIPCHEKPEGLVSNYSKNMSHGSLCSSEGNLENERLEEKTPSSNLRDHRHEILNSGPIEPPSVTTSPKKVTHEPPLHSVTMHLQPVEMLKNLVDAADASQLVCQPNGASRERRQKRMLSSFDSSGTNAAGANLLRDHKGGDQDSKNPPSEKRTQRKRRKVGEGENDRPSTKMKPSPKRKPGRPVKVQNESSPLLTGKVGNGIKNVAEVQKDSAEVADMGVILGLECNHLSGKGSGKAHKSPREGCSNRKGDQELQLNDPSVHNTQCQLQAGESTLKRRRGRPRKMLVSSLKIPEQNENIAKEEVIVKDCITSVVDSHRTAGVVSMEGSALVKESVTLILDGANLNDNQSKSGSTAKVSPAQIATESNDQPSIRQHEKQLSKRTRRRRSVNKNSSNQDSSDATGRKTPDSVSINKDVRAAIEEGPSNMLDDQPLSKWFEEMHSPGVSAAPMPEQCTELNKRENESKQAASHDDKGTVISNEPEKLLFVKNTLLWKAVESMEVFQKMPQNPHFMPLQACKESSREGLAIACMVNFSGAVDKITRLQFDDPKEKIDDILDSLDDLESHGFDVQILRDRISELLSIKENDQRLHDQKDEIKQQIAMCKSEMVDMDVEIVQINNQITELQKKIALVQSSKKMKDSEIVSLECRLQEVEESIRSARSNYGDLAAGVV